MIRRFNIYLLLLVSVTGVCFGQERVTLNSLLREMTDVSAPACWPRREYVLKQASSYDRRSVSPATLDLPKGPAAIRVLGAPKDWNFITVKGRGIYLGNTFSVNNHLHAWHGEGDQKIWVDADRFPSEFGTGTEGYYNTSWAPVVLYQTPFSNAPRADNADSYGPNTFTRTRMLDAIPFKTASRFDWETLAWQDGAVDASATVYWYGDGGQQSAQGEDYKIYNPAYHFYPSGDPTGLFYIDGQYYNNWGTAKSTDLVHWRYTPEGLARIKASARLRDASVPIAEKDSIRRRQVRLGGSGTIVIDRNNSSGFGKDGRPPLVSLWHNDMPPWNNQVVGIAYSNDTARNWTRYEKFPVLDINSREFRDPKVFWYEPSHKWIMVIGWAESPKVKFFSSPNLKDWEFLSDFGPWGATNGVWECADFFPLAVDGDSTKIKWVLSISVQPQNAQYFIGDFDGKRFTLDQEYLSQLDVPLYVPGGQVLFDFEHGIDDWKMEGNAFVESPASQALWQQGAVMGYIGRYFVNSDHDRGAGTGSILSPDFTIGKPYINFLVSGNYVPGKESVDLLVDGKVVRSQTGNNSGGMLWVSWDVSEWLGKRAVIRIEDASSEASICVDEFILSDEPAYTGRQKAFWIDYGADFFAVRSWNNYPESEKRKIWTAWMGSWRYGGTEPVRGIQTIPREVALRSFPEGVRLVQSPVKELVTLRKKTHTVPAAVVEGKWVPGIQVSKNAYELEVEFENEDATAFGLKLCAGGQQKTIVGYSMQDQQLYLDRRNSGLDSFIGLFPTISAGPLKTRNNTVRMHVFVDNSSIEVFGNDGETVLSSKIYPDPSSLGIEFFSNQGKVKVRSLIVWELSPVDNGFTE